MREEVVHLAQVGMRAGWHVEEPACEVDLDVVVQCKVRCDCVVVADRAGQAKLHDSLLEPRHELAVDKRHDGLIIVRVVEAAIPVTIIAAAVRPGAAVVGPGQVLLELQVVVLQPEDVELERIVFLLERLVFAAKLEQARIEQHLADDGKSFNALHGAAVH